MVRRVRVGPLPPALDLDPLRRELYSHEAGPGDYVLFGSAVMYLHGLREQIGDIDLFVRRQVYGRMRQWPEWVEHCPREGDPPFLEADLGVGVPVHAFHSWQRRDPMVDVGACFRNAETVQGLSCVPLWLVRVHKVQALEIVKGFGFEGREVLGTRWAKHVRDIETIERALAA